MFKFLALGVFAFLITALAVITWEDITHKGPPTKPVVFKCKLTGSDKAKLEKFLDELEFAPK